MGELTELLGLDEMKRAGGSWRVHWVRKHPELTERAIAELRAAVRERDIVNRAAWFTDLLKRWRADKPAIIP